jgi:hypothetical protein
MAKFVVAKVCVLHWPQFDILMKFLGPEMALLKPWGSRTKLFTMDPRFQLALTLMRFRRGYKLTDLSYRYNLDRNLVGNLFITWTQFMYKKFSDLRDLMFVPTSFHKPVPPPFQNSLLRNV